MHSIRPHSTTKAGALLAQPMTTQSTKGISWMPSLISRIMAGLIVGLVIGALKPSWGHSISFLRDIFLNLMYAATPFLIFSLVVTGIASGKRKHLGRLSAKTFVYFLISTTVALLLGFAFANLLTPGEGPVLTGVSNISDIITLETIKPMSLTDLVVHIFPASLVDAMVKVDVLQILAFSIIFGMALSAVGERAQSILMILKTLNNVMFKFIDYIMIVAPVGIAAGMANAVGKANAHLLEATGLLIGSLYLSLMTFVILLVIMALLLRLPFRPFLRSIRVPFTIAFTTTSSVAALPPAMDNMEQFGVSRRIVSLVIPTGYAFNLAGTTLFLGLASVFVAQAAGLHPSLGQQFRMFAFLILISKTLAGVPRASLVILLATVNSLDFIPSDFGPIAVAVIFTADQFMDMARTSVNVIGNCLAAVVLACWEGEFDRKQAAAFRVGALSEHYGPRSPATGASI